MMNRKLAFLAAIPFLFSCESVYQKIGYGHGDWFAEEIAEALIESKFGIDADLSPESPE